jgi:hypothetical protein
VDVVEDNRVVQCPLCPRKIRVGQYCTHSRGKYSIRYWGPDEFITHNRRAKMTVYRADLKDGAFDFPEIVSLDRIEKLMLLK